MKAKPMAKCGLQVKGQPKCPHQLDKEGMCSVHCRAKTRHDGDGHPCKKRHIKGRKRCRKHGGASPAGIASPNLTTGEHSRYLTVLSGKMRERFEQVQKNPDLLSLSPDIYMLDARMEEVVARSGQGESGKLWRQAKQAFDEFATAQAAKDREGSIVALTKLGSYLRAGLADYQAWDEVKDLWRHRARLVESERKRLIESQQMMTIDVMLVLATALTSAVKRHVTNPDTLSAIQRDVDRSTAGQGAFTGFTDTQLVKRG